MPSPGKSLRVISCYATFLFLLHILQQYPRCFLLHQIGSKSEEHHDAQSIPCSLTPTAPDMWCEEESELCCTLVDFPLFCSITWPNLADRHKVTGCFPDGYARLHPLSSVFGNVCLPPNLTCLELYLLIYEFKKNQFEGERESHFNFHFFD